jgi:hypothetical protein
VTDARRALLGELIDHAPLFPPASLPLDEALEDHRRARSSPHAWMVKRFVCPASRIGELDGADLRLSVVIDEPPAQIHVDRRVEAIEGLDPVLGLAPEIYVEVRARHTELLGQIGATGARAKVRCGGRSVPSVEELAAFVRACHEASVAFKATAGLHHAVRTESEHGFLNLLAAVVFGHEEDALADADEEAFRLDDEAFAWRDRRASAADLTTAREERFSGIGSCSFTEPVEDLERLEIL